MTEESKQERFTLNLPGLLEVLAGSLYSTPKVGLRELIQNAHDSCLRRQMEEKQSGYKPRIDILTDEVNHIITIQDNGHGLDVDDIRQYLATIGRSYTRQFKENLAFFSPEESTNLIGEFGMGFLSAFLIADSITLNTRSIKPDSEALCWQSQGGEYYEVVPTIKGDAGTSVELHVKLATRFLLKENILIETIRQYADFLQVPIYVNYETKPINLMTPPWQADDPEQASYDYVSRAFQENMKPLCLIPLHDQVIDVGNDEIIIPLKGFLFVPPSSVASVQEFGDLRVYIRRMFIIDQERKLLPSWARFVRGVIDCPYLQPTASRESVHEDETFHAVQQALEIQLGQALERIADEEPETWHRIVSGHTDVITGWAVRDDSFFERVAPIVTFRTSRGYLTLPEYLKITGDTFYFLTRHLGALQEQLLAEGHDAPVIDAHWFAVKPFLQKFANWHTGVDLVQMDGEVDRLMRPVESDPYQALVDYYKALHIKVEVVSFKPVEVPALMTYPIDAEFHMDTKQALEQEDLPSYLADFVEDYMENQQQQGNVLQGTLHLNTACPLIQRMAQKDVPPGTFTAVLMLIYQIARLFSGRALTAKDATHAFKQTIQAMEILIQ